MAKRLVDYSWLLLMFLLFAECGGEGPARDVCEGDATCNSRGTCDDSSGAVVCTCDQGWGGIRCDQCAAGYQDYGDGECRPTDPCADAACAAENRECTNDQGTAVCGDCLPGYHEEGGVCIVDTTCQPTSCNGHGVCDDSTGSVTCTCDTGYAGQYCAACDTGYEDYGDGACRPSDPCATAGCAAENRECTNDQGTAVCGDCLAGYHDEGGVCVADTTCQPNSCSDHGVCDDSGGTLTCACDLGYTGDRCEACDTGFQDYGDGECRPSDPCANYTDCDPLFRECTNDQGTPVCGDCLPGYHEEAGVCVVDTTCQATSCNGHGLCDDSTGAVICTCDAGYAGDHCEACDQGYSEWPPDSGDCGDDPCDPDPCNVPNAVPDGCEQTEADAYICLCEAGYDWDGAACVVACLDADQDGYGEGPACLGTDCDDTEPAVHQGASELCDGLDNDCDPATADGADEPTLGDPCDGLDSDRCQEGNLYCDGAAGMACDDTTGDIPEICDGLDNDCNPATADGADEPTLGDPCDGQDSDLCQEGNSYCDGAAGLACDDTTGDIPEICDGLDNDCNLATADGADEPTLGDPCDGADADLCPEGTSFCNGAAGMACDDTTGDIPEICDGLDNDCDPATADGADEPTLGDPCDGPDNDWCNEGVVYCNGTGGLACNDTTGDINEICDGVDNNCNVLIDQAEVPVSVMCPDAPHASEDCAGAMGCVITSCITNYYDVDGAYANGCECLADPLPTIGSTCVTAINLNNFLDSVGRSVSVTGNTAPPGRSVWYTFVAQDDYNDNIIGDEYHAMVEFVVNPGNAYVFDVYGGGCPGVGTQQCVAESAIWEFYTNFNRTYTDCTLSAPCGEGDCRNVETVGYNICNDDTRSYYVRVYRLDGAMSCTNYTLRFSNGICPSTQTSNSPSCP